MKQLFFFTLFMFFLSAVIFSQKPINGTDSITVSKNETLKTELSKIVSSCKSQLDNLKNELKTREIKKRKRMFLYICLLLFFLVLFITVFFIIRLRLKKSNILLSKKNEEIKQQQQKIEEQKNKLTLKAADLLVLNMQLKEIDNLKEGLTAMLVHDLKHPINNILNLTEDKEITSFANQMLNIVSNILDVQKYEKSNMELNKKEYPAFQITDDAIREIKILAEHKNIKVENKVSQEYILNIDLEIVQRILVNLLTNSIKYTPDNGNITVSSEYRENEPLFLYLKVTDTGIGIQKNKIETIFNKFNQVIAKKTGHARSTGLGLTFCKMAVEAHGGEIVAESDPDKETNFIFNLPIAKISEETIEHSVLTVDNKLNIILNDEDRMYLKQFIGDMKKTEIYDISGLRKISEQIDETFSENIKKWKKELSKAIYNCNEIRYGDLLNLTDS